MDERMDDVRAVMDAVGFQTAYLMGISEGGSLAAIFAAHHPSRCDGLILYGSFARFKYWFPDEASLQMLFDYIEKDWGSGKSLPRFAPAMAGDPAFLRWWGQFERLGATPGAAISLMRMNSQIDISDVLASIRVPTLVIHVANDVLIDVQAGQELAQNISGAQYVELPGQDHLPWGENADRIIEVVAPFLEQTRSRESSDRVLATVLLILPLQSAEALADVAAMTVKAELLRYRAARISCLRGGIAGTFDGPGRGLECALSLADRLRNTGVAHRIGLHTGEISLDAGVLEGMAVEIATDVATHALPNEILASRTVHDLVAGSGIVLEDHGEFALPSLDQRWHLFRVPRRQVTRPPA